MKKESFYASAHVPCEYFSPTMSLRYAPKEIDLGNGKAKIDLRLQQMWQGSNGTQEWQWIEEVELDPS